MADLQRLRDFADANNFDLTRPLRHNQVKLLAEAWRPETFFWHAEKFFPISLADMIDMVETHFASLPPVPQNEWRVRKLVRQENSLNGIFRDFPPPVVHVPDGAVTVANMQMPAVRVLNDGTAARSALALPEVNSDTVITHGASVRRAGEFFGALTTVSGLGTPAEADPYLPRADEEDPTDPPNRRPRMTVMAAFLNLVDLLKYELLVAESGNYPPDGLRRGFDIVDNLLRSVGGQAAFLTPQMKRQLLLDQIASLESGGTIPPTSLPPGWHLDRVAWNTVTRYSFLEYYFFYAYNDYEDHEDALFANEHEGDDEGCCLVFERDQLNLAALDPNAATLLLRIVPSFVITSVHEEFMDADGFRFIDPPIQNPGDPPRPARQLIDFKVYVAAGSHATYLTSGQHELADFGDAWGFVEEHPEILLLIGPAGVLAVAIIIAIYECFIEDTEDSTSDTGIHAVPPDEVDSDDPSGVSTRVLVLPMSSDIHIYDGTTQTNDLLLLRSYAGKWGDHDGLIDKSPPFVAKSGRYFRKLLHMLNG